jgi:hypothetical protein
MVDFLCKAGIVEKVGDDDNGYVLTLAGRSCMSIHMVVHSPFLFFASRDGVALDQCTLLELMLELHREGWERQLYPSGKVAAYTSTDCPKVFYYAPGANHNRYYFLALLQSSTLITKGLPGLHHRQLVMYYRAVCEVPDDLLNKVIHGKPAKTYRALLELATNMEDGPGFQQEDEGWTAHLCMDNL